jgi:hypothetical protein
LRNYRGMTWRWTGASLKTSHSPIVGAGAEILRDPDPFSHSLV